MAVQQGEMICPGILGVCVVKAGLHFALAKAAHAKGHTRQSIGVFYVCRSAGAGTGDETDLAVVAGIQLGWRKDADRHRPP